MISAPPPVTESPLMYAMFILACLRIAWVWFGATRINSPRVRLIGVSVLGLPVDIVVILTTIFWWAPYFGWDINHQNEQGGHHVAHAVPITTLICGIVVVVAAIVSLLVGWGAIKELRKN